MPSGSRRPSRARLATFATPVPQMGSEPAKSSSRDCTLALIRSQPSRRSGRDQRCIDKSALALPEPRRVRDRDHVRYVAKQPCLVCGRQPSDAHHLRFAQSRALGRKVSDEFTVPLCRGHHREVHRCGDEAAWWQKAGIDPTVSARALWLETHPLPTGPDRLPAGIAATRRPSPLIGHGDAVTANLEVKSQRNLNT